MDISLCNCNPSPPMKTSKMYWNISTTNIILLSKIKLLLKYNNSNFLMVGSIIKYSTETLLNSLSSSSLSSISHYFKRFSSWTVSICHITRNIISLPHNNKSLILYSMLSFPMSTQSILNSQVSLSDQSLKPHNQLSLNISFTLNSKTENTNL